MNVSKSEQVVLEALWSESPLTVGQVIERVQGQFEWHENTIKTLLSRLIKKNAVERYKDGKRYFYTPGISRESVVTEETEGFLSRFFHGEISPLIAHFAKTKRLSPSEIAEIESILKKLKKDHD